MRLTDRVLLATTFSATVLTATALLVPGCSGKEDDAGGVGSECDLEAESACSGDLECTPSGDGGVCTYPRGGSCDLEDDELDNGGCAADALCQEVAVAAEDTAMGGASSSETETICVGAVGSTCDPLEPYCADGLSCAETGEEYKCWEKVVLRGEVSDTSDASAIAGANVIALNDLRFAVTDVAVSADDGSYELEIPVARDEDGAPLDSSFTLNGSAQDYQPFPSGVRVALPILASEAVMDEEDGFYVIENALTEIGLIPLGEGTRFMAKGSVVGLIDDSANAGLLIVATGDSGTFTAITDLGGSFTLFNLPSGSYEVRAYGDGIQVEMQTISIEDDNIEELTLSEVDEGTTAVSGSVQIVNPGDGDLTSVILVVADTFDPDVARGEVPRGLRAPRSGPVGIDGAFTIENVPEGRYVALAAYENDFLVRDPDTCIAGTDFVFVDVTADSAELTIEQSFKVTGALDVIAPGAERPEAVTEKPLLEWVDDSSEEWYDVQVFDAFGELVWEANDVLGPSGSTPASVQYDGPLEPGMYYQYRVTSRSEKGNGDVCELSQSEDLLGVFYLPAP